ncbi:uncharacterized protein LOC107272487 [Cephus cinctus]|uniref:Uncharacterized protein LOC107272487 n=1 Tax=Cephus cinctus TaxID=211228 RepID=A0AAJ7CAQ1_CEPCN|nr:uncharacterized protein LOC107272487 [Cephus cinctus]
MEGINRFSRTDENFVNSHKDRKTLAMGNADEDEEAEEEEREKKYKEREILRYPRSSLCTVCHVEAINANPDDFSNRYEPLACSQGHLLCYRCIKKFAIRSDVGCILCDVESQRSNSSCSRDSNTSLKKTNKPYEVQNVMSGSNVHDYHVNPWVRGYPSISKPVPKKRQPRYGSAMHGNDSTTDWETDLTDTHDRRTVNEARQQSSYCSIIKDEEQVSPSQMKIGNQGTSECSRRPIRCPRLDCAVNVAFSSLTHHFLFDHPEVPILNVEPGAKSTLIVSFTALSCDSSRCLALLLVSGKLSGPATRLFSSGQIQQKYKNRLPLPVLAARLHSTSRYCSHNEGHACGEGHDEGDVIIAWVAGLDIGSSTRPLKCSIQAVDNIDNEGFRSLTYTGPVNSLRTAQKPREVFLSGDCVILHEGLINHITSDCTSLNVNVIIH